MELGIDRVQGWLKEFPYDELLGWIEYAKLQPFGNIRGDLQAGLVAATVHNASRTKKSQPVMKPEDGMGMIAQSIKRLNPSSNNAGGRSKRMGKSGWSNFYNSAKALVAEAR